VRAVAASALRRLPRVQVSVPPKLRRRLIVAVLLAAAFFALYRFWFRESSFVSVQHVTVTGLTTNDAPRITTALTAAAHDMSTLKLDQSALNSAVTAFPIVKSVQAQASFPHTLKIHVVEQEPVAVLSVGGERLLLAPDGSVLRDVATGHPLALIKSGGAVPQNMLTDRVALSSLHIAAAAPVALAGRIITIAHEKEGIVAHMRGGPNLIFGNDSTPFAKWAAAAAVLADSSSKGATYIDVRIPGRAVAGGVAADTLAPLSSTGQDTSGQSNTGATGATGAAGGGGLSTQNPQPSTGG
jgi:cell division protein FtsQ